MLTNINEKTTAAACGLFCESCLWFLATKEDLAYLEVLAGMQNWTLDEARCEGCGSSKTTPYCSSCKMKKCTQDKGIDFCIECTEYPCEELKAFQSELPHRIELWESQKRIKEIGYEQWHQEQLKHYACSECGTTNTAFNIECRKCNHTPSCNYVSIHQEKITQMLVKMYGDN